MLDLQYKDKPNKQSEMTQIVSTISEISAIRKQIESKNAELKSVKTVEALDRISVEIADLAAKMRVKADLLQVYVENYEAVVNVTLS